MYLKLYVVIFVWKKIQFVFYFDKSNILSNLVSVYMRGHLVLWNLEKPNFLGVDLTV